MSSYDYPSIIQQNCTALIETVGLRLTEALVQIVEPEFNAFYMVFENSTYSISGRIGSEILGIQLLDSTPTAGKESITTVTKPFRPFDIFLGHRVTQARMIGEAWNGHGFEFSFEGLPNRTLIVQSIYAGSQKEQEFHDCLRLGVGHYYLHDDPNYLATD